MSWSDITNISTAIASIAALIITVGLFKIGLDREEKRDRPIISVSESRITYETNPKLIFVPVVKIRNYGARPAYNFRISCYTYLRHEKSKTYSLISPFDSRLSNSVVSGKEIDFGMATIEPKDSGVYFFKISLEYNDAISNAKYFEDIHYSWSYVPNRWQHSQLMEVSMEEAIELNALQP